MTADDGGRVVPAYALTHGRTRAQGVDLPLEAVAVVTQHGVDRYAAMSRERRDILDLCAQPASVAEVAAHLAVPLGVARVLVGDLAVGGHLAVHLPQQADGRPSPQILIRLLEGLRAR